MRGDVLGSEHGMQLSTLGCSPLGSCSDVCGPLHKDTENLRQPDLARLLRAAAHALPQVLVSGALGEQQLQLTSVSQAAHLCGASHCLLKVLLRSRVSHHLQTTTTRGTRLALAPSPQVCPQSL